MDQSQVMMRDYLLVYKQKGDKKLAQLNGELQAAHRRADALYAVVRKSVKELSPHNPTLIHCGAGSIVPQLYSILDELRSSQPQQPSQTSRK